MTIIQFDYRDMAWGDYYKWARQCPNGVPERFCIGTDTTDWEKFEKWGRDSALHIPQPRTTGHIFELKTAFGIDKLLNPRDRPRDIRGVQTTSRRTTLR